LKHLRGVVCWRQQIPLS